MKKNTQSRRISDQGYVLIYAPGHPMANKSKWALEHRMVWFDLFGPIPNGYHIHHKNHDRADNSVANLECVAPSAHSKAHNPKGMASAVPLGRRNTSGLLRAHRERCERLNANKQWTSLVCDGCGRSYQLRTFRARATERYAHHFCSASCKCRFAALKAHESKRNSKKSPRG